MFIKILKEKLEKGLDIVSKISVKKISLPILANVLLETEKNFLKMSATNLESGIIWWSLAKIEKEGKTCVPSKIFYSVISSIKEDTILLINENNNLKIENENISLKINGLNPEDFPIIPKKDSLEKVSLDTEVFCSSLTKIINIPSLSIGRPEISGILFLFEKNWLKMVATDSFRLAEKKIKIEENLNNTYSLIIPQNTAREIIGVFGKEKGKINIYISPSQIFFEKIMEEINHPEILFTSRLIEGEFPNYQEILPKKYKTKILLNKEDFLNQIKTASIFSSKLQEILLKINPKEKKIEINSKNPELGEYKSVVLGKIEGEEMKISFNFRFIFEGISIIDEKEFYFLLTDEEGPAILKPVNSEDYFYILMPVKIN